MIEDNNRGSDWIPDLLASQILDPSDVVAQSAVMVVSHMVTDLNFLNSFLAVRPSIDALQRIDRSVCYKLLEIESGFEYVQKWGNLQEELEMWINVSLFNLGQMP
jgi:hypothetical protein